jgi:Fe-Mn family superoxide dismutase
MRDDEIAYIDARTMEIHHSKHHNAYTTNQQGTDMEGKIIENILINLDMKNTAVQRGGGFYNHNLLNVMTPNGRTSNRRFTNCN